MDCQGGFPATLERKRTYRVPAVEKSLRILECLGQDSTGLTLAELSRRTRISKATVFMILETLAAKEYVQRNELGRWWLGLRLLYLGSLVIDRLQVRDQALPFMRELAEKTGFTVHLAVAEQGEAVYIQKEEGPNFVRFWTYVGARLPLHCTGVGKALLAYMDESELNEYLSSNGFDKRTPNTLTAPSAILEDLGRTRSRGYSIDDEEDEFGIRCIGAPVFDHRSKLVAGVSATALVSDLPDDRIESVGRLVAETGKLISLNLGATTYPAPPE